jgi:DNA-binding MarR family transcriptional regulator
MRITIEIGDLPPIVITLDDEGRPAAVTRPLGTRQLETLALLEERPGLSTDEVALAIDTSTGNTHALLHALRERDLVRRTDDQRPNRWYKQKTEG